MSSPLQNNITNLQSLLEQVNALPEAVTLPELTNEGSASDLLSGKQLINQEGNIVSGTIETFDGSYECSGESTDDSGVVVKSLIGQITCLHPTNKYTVHYTNQYNLTYESRIVPGDGYTLSMWIPANTLIYVDCNSSTGSGIDILDQYGRVILPIENAFRIELN